MSEAIEQDAATQQQVPHERVVMLPLPDGMRRMESGPVQFGDDWPGVFLRGDNAMAYAMYLRNVAEVIECNDPGHAFDALQLRWLADELSGCKAI